MNGRLKRSLIAGAAVAALAVGGVAVAGAAGAAGSGDNETPIRGEALTMASAVALEHVGGGRVSETEVGDEEGYHEVEVTRPDGSQVDVHLDRGFTVRDQSVDPDGADHRDGPDDRDGPNDG